MNDDSFSWSDLLDWIIFSNPGVRQNIPPLEAKDGQEPTVERLREEARQADAKLKSGHTNILSSTTSKTLDKEFWETM
jgi:hypothetical protein